MNKVIMLSVVGVSVAMLAGCAHQTQKFSNSPLFSLDTVAIQTSQNVQELSAMKASSLHKTSTDKQWREFMFNLQSIPKDFAKKETFNYVGTVQKAIEGIAGLANYKVYIVGNAPAQPIMISISAKDQVLMDTLRDVNAQIGDKASISLAPNARLITLTFNQAG